MSIIITELTALIPLVKQALTSLAGMWIVAIPAAFFVLGLGAKFLFGLMGRGKKRRR